MGCELFQLAVEFFLHGNIDLIGPFCNDGNLYESIAIIAKRANQINITMKEELHSKLEEFATHTDSLEEINENKEQIEISKAYERMPNAALLATQEFMEDKIYYRKNDDDLFK